MFTNTPFYADWTFWAFVSSALAIVLSQLPPLSRFLIPPLLSVEVAEVICLTHFLGNPNVNFMISIHNVGGRITRIKTIEIEFRRDGKFLTTLPIRSYFLHPDSRGAITLFPFNLAPNYEWVHSVHGFTSFSKEEDRKIRELVSNARADVQEKAKSYRKKYRKDPQENFKIEPQLAAAALAHFEKNFVWLPGEYEMRVKVGTSKGMVVEPGASRFTVFESDTKELRSYADAYDEGRGFAFPNPRAVPGLEFHLKPL